MSNTLIMMNQPSSAMSMTAMLSIEIWAKAKQIRILASYLFLFAKLKLWTSFQSDWLKSKF